MESGDNLYKEYFIGIVVTMVTATGKVVCLPRSLSYFVCT